MKYLTPLVLPLILLTACSSQPPQPPVFSESFITHISDDGIKFFSYAIVLTPHQGKHRTRSANRQRISSPKSKGRSSDTIGHANVREMQKKMADNTELVVVERLEQHLKKTAYCTSDYFILERNIGFGKGHIRGECK